MTTITRVRRAPGDNAAMSKSAMKPLLAFCLLTGTALTQAAIVNVGGMSNGFLPRTVTVHVGDTVTFINKGGFHNVIADDGSFRCARGCDNDGHGGSGTASSASWVAQVTFANAGTYGYFCEIHGQPGAGMFGTVIVQDDPPPPPPPPATDSIPVAGIDSLALLIGAILASGLAALIWWRR
jgi:plastocyanin